MMARVALLAAMLLVGGPSVLGAASVEPSYKVLPGKMPILPGQTPSDFAPGVLAPVPNYDLDAPHARADGRARLEPGIIDRDGRRHTDVGEFAPGAGYSQSMERKSRPQTGFGSTLAPSVMLRVPLK